MATRAAAILALALAAPAAFGQGLPETLPERLPGAPAPVTPAPPPDGIETAPIPDAPASGAGLIPAAEAGLPAELWTGSDAGTLAGLIAAVPTDALPAAQALYRRLLLIEAAPPPGDAGEALILARIDALMRLGEVEPALALIERAGPDSPALFSRWFDALLLDGSEDRGCATLAVKPELSPGYAARIFCLARGGRWTTAALTLDSAAALGAIDEGAWDRMARFLDPDLFEGMDPAPVPDAPTPLDYRMLEAIGEPLDHDTLPLAYARADLRHVIGWQAQIAAAERLARAGSLDPNVLLGIYTLRRPDRSGGVWDRVALIQRLDVALSAASAAGVAAYLPAAHAAMTGAGLEAALAALVAPRLARIELSGEAADLAARLILVSNTSAALAAPRTAPTDKVLTTAAAIAAGKLPEPTGDARIDRIAAAFAMQPAPPPAADLGALLLEALAATTAGAAPDEAARAIATLRAAGLENAARHAAAQYLLLAPPR